MIWTHDGLWQKAKVYIARAFESDRESPLFPFWASLALEFLARAALAKISPTLLADPQNPENLLFALNIPATDKPKSIPMKTVFIRCGLIWPDFTTEVSDACVSLIERRNSELHSGDPAFDGFHTSAWLAQFCKSSSILLAAQGKNLKSFIPNKADAKAAMEMVKALESSVRDEAKRLIGESGSRFKKLSAKARTAQLAQALRISKLEHRVGTKFIGCPACDAQARLKGRRIRITTAVLRDNELYWESIFLPSAFRCFACGLEIHGYSILQGANLGGQFVEQHSADPSEYFSPAEEYFEEYNNM